MIVTCKATGIATELQVAADVSEVLRRRAALKHPPVTMTISDQVALGIADIFRSRTPSGQVFERFVRTGAIDTAELIHAAEVEQGYSSPEGHAALYCLIGWARARERSSSRHPAAAD